MRRAFRITEFVVTQVIRLVSALRKSRRKLSRPGMQSQTFVCLESENRSRGTATNATWVLDTPIPGVTGFSVQDVEIPFAWYPINANNNSIRFVQSSTTYDITLTAGVYTPDELATELQTQLNAATSGFTVTFSETTLKFTVSNSTAFNIIDDNNTTAQKLIGLSGDTGSVTSWVSDNVIDLSGTRHVLLESNLASLINRPRVNTSCVDIIHRFPVTGNPGDVMSDPARNNARFRVTDARRNINEITIRLIDDAGNELDLGGHQFTITLLIDFLAE